MPFNEHNPKWLTDWLNNHVLDSLDKTLDFVEERVFLLPSLRNDLGETEDDDEWNRWLFQQDTE